MRMVAVFSGRLMIQVASLALGLPATRRLFRIHQMNRMNRNAIMTAP